MPEKWTVGVRGRYIAMRSRASWWSTKGEQRLRSFPVGTGLAEPEICATSGGKPISNVPPDDVIVARSQKDRRSTPGRDRSEHRIRGDTGRTSSGRTPFVIREMTASGVL